jgi:colicin import membrane protein
MRQSLPIGKEPNLQTIIITSAVLHLLFITLIIIPLKSKEREYKTYFVNVVTPAQIQTPSRKPAARKKGKVAKSKSSSEVKVKPALKRRVRPKKGVSLEPVETKRVSKQIERLRAISAIEKKKKSKEEALARAREADESVEQAIEGIKKRKIVTVSTGAGIPGVQVSADSESYYALITQKIWGEWVYPDLDTSDLEVVISINIDSSGKIISHYIEESSGNKIFDRSASKAIIKASPLPSPPVEMEVGVRFRL